MQFEIRASKKMATANSQENPRYYESIKPASDIFLAHHPHCEKVDCCIREMLNNITDTELVLTNMETLKMLALSYLKDCSPPKKSKVLAWFETTYKLMVDYTNGIVPPSLTGFDLSDIYMVGMFHSHNLGHIVKSLQHLESFWMKNYAKLEDLSDYYEDRPSLDHFSAKELILKKLRAYNPKLYFECELMHNPLQLELFANHDLKTKFEYLKVVVSLDMSPREMKPCKPIQYVLKRIIKSSHDNVEAEEDVAIRLLLGNPNLKDRWESVRVMNFNKKSIGVLHKRAPRLSQILETLQEEASNPKTLKKSINDLIWKKINLNKMRYYFWKNSSKVLNAVPYSSPGEHFKIMLQKEIDAMGIPKSLGQYLMDNRPYEFL